MNNQKPAPVNFIESANAALLKRTKSSGRPAGPNKIQEFMAHPVYVALLVLDLLLIVADYRIADLIWRETQNLLLTISVVISFGVFAIFYQWLYFRPSTNQYQKWFTGAGFIWTVILSGRFGLEDLLSYFAPVSYPDLSRLTAGTWIFHVVCIILYVFFDDFWQSERAAAEMKENQRKDDEALGAMEKALQDSTKLASRCQNIYDNNPPAVAYQIIFAAFGKDFADAMHNAWQDDSRITAREVGQAQPLRIPNHLAFASDTKVPTRTVDPTNGES